MALQKQMDPHTNEKDKVTGREILRTIKFEQRATLGKDLKTLLMPTKLPESEARKVGRGRVEG